MVIDDPAGFYINLHTGTHRSGLMRGQLTAIAPAPVIHLASPVFLTADAIEAHYWFAFTGLDDGSSILINGADQLPLSNQFGFVLFGLATEGIGLPEPLFMQVRNSQGVLSAPYIIVSAPAAKINSTPVTTVDAAKFGTVVAPEAIVAAFGSKLATQSVGATSLPLPTLLDGTSVYVDGVAAGLLYVSGQQVNYVIPSGTSLGPADVVIVARDGTVSRGKVNVAGSIPAIFTGKSGGAGAPAGLVSRDGQSFDILLSNADGAPVPIDAGNYVALFGTGMRFASTPMKITIGGVEIDPLFFGPQGSFEALDQVNLQIPQSLAGKGDVDLVLTLDSKTSNTVKLRIR